MGGHLRRAPDALDLPPLIGRCVSFVGGAAKFTSIRRRVDVKISRGSKCYCG